jgi:hypothetical protein
VIFQQSFTNLLLRNTQIPLPEHYLFLKSRLRIRESYVKNITSGKLVISGCRLPF